MQTLDVYLHWDLVGQLIQDRHGQRSFAYTTDWLANPVAVPVSHSLPLRAEPFVQRDCIGFFEGLLPEAHQRRLIADRYTISENNEFALLKAIGGECAGAVTFVPAGEPYPEQKYAYKPLSEVELAAELQTLPQRPLMSGAQGVRMSLAGAQAKMVVALRDGQMFLPLEGAPSTHIIKPASSVFPDIVQNEAFCMQLAQRVELDVAEVEDWSSEMLPYLLVKRFDRREAMYFMQAGEKYGLHTFAVRLHQEDFCQALGLPSSMKYQNDGGPSLRACFELVRTVSSLPAIDLQRLLDAVIFNVLIGNTDAHAKNFSLLYGPGTGLGQTVRLAPLYDLVSTAYYPDLSKDMAMSIGGESKIDRIGRTHFEGLAKDAGLAAPLVVRRVADMIERVAGVLGRCNPAYPVQRLITEQILARCDRMRPLFR